MYIDKKTALCNKGDGFDSLSTLNYKDKEKVIKILDKHLPMLAKHAELELLSRKIASQAGGERQSFQTFSSAPGTIDSDRTTFQVGGGAINDRNQNIFNVKSDKIVTTLTKKQEIRLKTSCSSALSPKHQFKQS